jgi:quercetin dioxygenase-like cupin family protein
MLSLDLNSLQLTENPMPRGSVRVEFPLHSAAGTASTAVVVFELDPGSELATHSDSAEETLYVLAGEGEAHVDGETIPVRAGDIAVVPAMAPHGARATGDTTLRVLGFFSSSTVVSTFEEPIGPEGENVFVWGATQPILTGSAPVPA